MISLQRAALTALTIVFVTGSLWAKGPTKKVKPAKDGEKVEWLTIEEAMKRAKSKPKKIVVDVYTDWCGWCKRMDKATFGNPEVAAMLSKDFYAVKFDAEGTQNVIFQDQVFKFNAGAKAHDLAVRWLNGQMGYPTIVYLDEKGKVLAAVPGYFDANDYKIVLKYFNENRHKKESLQAFMDKEKKGGK